MNIPIKLSQSFLVSWRSGKTSRLQSDSNRFLPLTSDWSPTKSVSHLFSSVRSSAVEFGPYKALAWPWHEPRTACTGRVDRVHSHWARDGRTRKGLPYVYALPALGSARCERCTVQPSGDDALLHRHRSRVEGTLFRRWHRHAVTVHSCRTMRWHVWWTVVFSVPFCQESKNKTKSYMCTLWRFLHVQSCSTSVKEQHCESLNTRTQ